MDEHCWWGHVLGHVCESWTCGRHGRPCCPACAQRDPRGATCPGGRGPKGRAA